MHKEHKGPSLSSMSVSPSCSLSSRLLKRDLIYKKGHHDLFADPLTLIEQDMNTIKHKLVDTFVDIVTDENRSCGSEEQRRLHKRIVHLEHERKRILKNQKRYRQRRKHVQMKERNRGHVSPMQGQELEEITCGSDAINESRIMLPLRRSSMVEMKAIASIIGESRKELPAKDTMAQEMMNDASIASFLMNQKLVGNVGADHATAKKTTCRDIHFGGKYVALQNVRTPSQRSVIPPARRKTIHIAKAA